MNSKSHSHIDDCVNEARCTHTRTHAHTNTQTLGTHFRLHHQRMCGASLVQLQRHPWHSVRSIQKQEPSTPSMAQRLSTVVSPRVNRSTWTSFVFDPSEITSSSTECSVQVVTECGTSARILGRLRLISSTNSFLFHPWAHHSTHPSNHPSNRIHTLIHTRAHHTLLLLCPLCPRCILDCSC